MQLDAYRDTLRQLISDLEHHLGAHRAFPVTIELTKALLALDGIISVERFESRKGATREHLANELYREKA